MIGERRKILVTGARGMLGWALTKELGPDYQFIGIDIEDADITDENQIKEEIFKIHPDIVVHAAAYTDVDNSEKNKELTYRINAKGTENIAHACRICQAKLIYISTDFVFDGKKNSPYTEEDTPNPINTYGATKYAGERLLQSILSNYLIIRTAWLYGPHGKNFVDKIIQMAQKEPELKVVNDQTGSPTYTPDLAKGINIAIKKDPIGILNITNSVACTWYEFAKKTLEIKGIQAKITPITSDKLDRLAKRPNFSALSAEKFQKLAGVKLRRWEEALEDYLKACTD